ncbi:hypothetical protein EVAR_41650_1 [Eumeta japonica]|uniref:Uncharacterized protein n=1 Tax=Eumeta variegata TaxID=151549 RepID=A0A4C1WZS9_EUMVA|nr:hypothetical protein EVAR_41650_1 [Eumeta japonica]
MQPFLITKCREVPWDTNGYNEVPFAKFRGRTMRKISHPSSPGKYSETFVALRSAVAFFKVIATVLTVYEYCSNTA